MDGFDAYSESYESHVERSIGFLGRGHDFYTRAKADRLIEQLARRLGAPRTLRVLDVGCGIGETDRFLKDRLGALRGADVSAESVERARRDNPGIPYDVIDGTTFPYADDSFDAAFAACVFHHVPPDQRLRLMEEIRRVLRPGGLMILFEHNPWQPLTRLAVSRCEFDRDAELLRLRDAQRLFREAAYGVVEARYILYLPFRVKGSLPSAWTRCFPFGAQYFVTGVAP